MWLLLRASPSDPDGPGVHVRSPDSAAYDAGNPEPWQWTVAGDPRVALTVETERSTCRGTTEQVGEATTIQRRAGTIVVLVSGSGAWTVSSGSGPWHRVLGPGDVFLAEDARDERLEVSPLPTPESGDTAVLNVVTVAPSNGGRPLRWIP